MKRVVGLALLLVGMFLLGLGVRRFFSLQSHVISPIPNGDAVRVIQVTPAPR